MRTIIRLSSLVVLAIVSLRAADDKVLAAVRALDDVRVAAMIGSDHARLDELLSDDLRYVHASGAIDTKTGQIDALASGRIIYHSIEFEERIFAPVAPGVVMVSGRGHFKVTNKGRLRDLRLAFLGVWRQESGAWRFFAWQSSRMDMPAAAPAAR